MKCWHCCMEITSKSKTYHLPINCDENHFSCIGYFCSLNCTKAYVVYGNLIHRKNDCLILLYKFYDELLQSLNINHINCSSPKEILEDFGGTYTYEDYHKLSIVCETDFNLSAYVIMSGSVDYLPNLEDTHTKYKKLKAINGQHFVKGKSKTLLKRSKPLKKVKHINLEESMGIKILNK